MLEKMTQVSTDAIVPVDKYNSLVAEYNHLVDICNDSAERIAELIERHKVYTSALNNDIADRDAKIELLEKGIEDRKEVYAALKELMDTKYISIDEHNKIVNQFKEEVKKLNKCIMEKNESINTGNEAIINLRKQIGGHEEENKRLSEKITSLKDTITELSHEIDNYKSWNADLHRDIKSEINGKNDLVDAYEKKYDEFEKKIEKLREEQKTLVDICDKYKKENGDYAVRVNNLTKELETEYVHVTIYNNMCQVITLRNEEIKRLKVENTNIRKEIEKLTNEDDHGREGFERYIKYIISTEETKFKAELNRKFSEEVSKISTKRTEEELAKMKEATEVKGVGRTSSGRYPWGAKIIRCTKPNDFHCMYGDDCPVEAAEKCKFAKEENNIPCGEDAIE